MPQPALFYTDIPCKANETTSSKMPVLGATEMAQQSGSFAALAQDPGLVLSTHMVSQLSITSGI